MSNERISKYIILPTVNFEKQILKSWSTSSQNIDSPTNGILDLDVLLGSIQPSLNGTRYVFAFIPKELVSKYSKFAKMIFHEEEGVTMIIPKLNIT